MVSQNLVGRDARKYIRVGGKQASQQEEYDDPACLLMAKVSDKTSTKEVK
jgi:hypothetical protein